MGYFVVLWRLGDRMAGLLAGMGHFMLGGFIYEVLFDVSIA
jgi:hypothetical protein